MEKNYDKLLENLVKLKTEFNATGLKLELETEIISTSELDLAKTLADNADIDLTIKTCGCSAVSDIFLAKAMGIKNLLAPMIESDYALDKFYSNVSEIYGSTKDVKLFFNLETITGFKNIDEILNFKYIEKLDGLVFGRNDFCSSLKHDAGFADSAEIFKYAQNVLGKTENKDIKFILGGNITSKSVDFMKKLKGENFTNFETRKIIFDKKILENDINTALNLALEFEILWLNSKSFSNSLDEKRKQIIEKRLHL